MTIYVDASDFYAAVNVLRENDIFFNINGFGGIMIEEKDEAKARNALYHRSIRVSDKRG